MAYMTERREAVHEECGVIKAALDGEHVRSLLTTLHSATATSCALDPALERLTNTQIALHRGPSAVDSTVAQSCCHRSDSSR